MRPTILLSSRAGGRYLACLVVSGLVCALWSRYTLKIHWATHHPAVDLPPGTWPLSATNILFLAGLAVLASPFVGALRAGSLTLLLYLSLTVAAQLDPRFGTWSPLAVVTWPDVEPLPNGKVALAVTTSAAALAVTVRTLGRTARTWGQDLDTA